MSRSKTLLLGVLIVAAALSALLATGELGLGRRDDGSPRFPYVLEDTYDRMAYQQRGRWLPSGGRPYLEDFAEYPQVSVWIMGLPYLTFDHGIAPAEESLGARSMRRPTSFASEARIEQRLRAEGFDDEAVDRFLDACWRAARDRSLERPPTAALVGRLGPDAGRVGAELAPELAELFERVRTREAELVENRVAYGDRHHIHMAILFVLLLALACANLARLGAAPGWALLVCLPASLYFGFNRLDLVVTNLVALAFFFQFRKRPNAAGAVLGLAILAKYYPVVLVPLFLGHNVQRELARGRPLRPAIVHGAVVPGLVAGLVILVLLGVTFVWKGGGLEAVLALPNWYLHERNPNHASLLAQVTHPERWGWFNVAQRGGVERVFQLIQLVPAAIAFLPLRSNRALVLAALVATLTMILFSEFFSPQWVLWVTALCIYVAPGLRRFLVLAVALELVMYVQLPLLYFEAIASRVPTEQFYTAPEFAPFRAVTDVRIVLVAVFLAVALWSLAGELRRQRQPGSEPGAPERVSNT